MESEHLSRAEIARNNFLEGYNCTQSVVLAFEDLFGNDREALVRAASSFGGGIGRLREVCGAISGMAIVMGLITGYATPETGEIKAEHYAHIQKLAHRFEQRHGSMICRILLEGSNATSGPVPEARNAGYYQRRPCPLLVESAAEILDEYICENFPEKYKEV